MCIWKWCIEGWVIVSIVCGAFFMTTVRGCQEKQVIELQHENQVKIEMAKQGLQQKVVSGSRINQRTIWVKEHNTSSVEYLSDD